MTDEIREAAIEAAAYAVHEYALNSTGICNIPIDVADEIARAAIDAYERAMWRPVEEAPHAEIVLLGWKTAWPEVMLEFEVGAASGGWRRDGWSTLHTHGRAQFFRPLPLPPEDKA